MIKGVDLMDKVSENTVLADLMSNEKALMVLKKYKVPCLTCPMASQEIKTLTIGQVAKSYGLNIEEMLNELKQID